MTTPAGRRKRRESLFAVTAMVVAVLTYSVLLCDRRLIALLAAREARLEQAGAVLFLLTSMLSILGLMTVFRQPVSIRRVRPIIFILLAIFFFAAFGEEVSWGSLLLGHHERTELFSRNVQGELNLHNLTIFDEYDASGRRKSGMQRLLTANRLFDYFMFSAFVVMPLASGRITSVRDWLSRQKIPALPAAFSLALLTNLLLTAASELLLVDGEFMHGAVSEVREFNYALLCMLGMLFLNLSVREIAPEGN